MKKIILSTTKLDSIDSLAKGWFSKVLLRTPENYIERIIIDAFKNQIQEFRRRVANLAFITTNSNFNSTKVIFQNIRELAASLELPINVELSMVEDMFRSFEVQFTEANA